MSKPVLIIFFLAACILVNAQEIQLSSLASLSRPRYLLGNTDKDYFQKLIASEDWATKIYDQSKKSIEEYVSRH
ncbi:MAG TPA: hypothetical protein VJ111_11295 [Chitinophagaceae bacterium]|nr:hypothetical protein [Chitinophagaceae bacterium]